MGQPSGVNRKKLIHQERERLLEKASKERTMVQMQVGPASRQHVQGRSWLQPNLMHETRISNQETTQAKGRSQRMEKENDKGKGARSHAARVKES